MDEKFKALQALGAGDFEHLNGSLISHLKGTQSILYDWGSDSFLCDAGLFHAAYGTAAFQENIVSLSQRNNIANIIGAEAEALVYLYCSCDRDYVFPKLKQFDQIQFKDRFTGIEFLLSIEQSKCFCELFVANELELVFRSKDFRNKYGKELLDLFEKMSSYLTPQAIQAYKSVLVKTS